MMTKEEHDRFCEEFAGTWASEKPAAFQPTNESLKSTLKEYIANMKLRDDFLVERGLFGEFIDWLKAREKAQ